jgi:hypothetical protein
MKIGEVGGGGELTPFERALQAWRDSLDESPESTLPAAQATSAMADTVAAALRAFDGSDVRLPDSAAMTPGSAGSAAPEAVDLSGEVTRISPQALAAQRMAMLPSADTAEAMVQASQEELQALSEVRGPSGVSVLAPSEASLSPNQQAAPLWQGDVTDGQAGDVVGSRVFDSTRLR